MKTCLRSNVEYDDDIAVLHMEGQLANTGSRSLVRDYMAIRKGTIQKIILDFKGINYINSSGVSALIKILRQDKETEVVFAGLNNHLRCVMEAVGFSDIVPTFADVEEAKKSKSEKKNQDSA